MNERVRETEVERDADGNVVERVYVERPKKKGGFGWGLVFGALLIAIAVVAFAYNQGSFQQAGVQADQATAQIEETAGQTAENAGDAIETAGDQAERVGDQAANETSDNATN